MTHAELVSAILQRAVSCGLAVWPTPPPSPHMAAGWVDVVVLGRSALFIEAKAQDGRRTMAQVKMASALTGAGLAYRLYRPSDLLAGVIDADLKAIA